jgi:hypothetical protein
MPIKGGDIKMTTEIKGTSWVYVLVQNPGSNEQIVGQRDIGSDIAFIPTFLDKDSAMQGVVHMVKEKGKRFEIQAIIYEDLVAYAVQSGFILFILDAEGRVIDKKVPALKS